MSKSIGKQNEDNPVSIHATVIDAFCFKNTILAFACTGIKDIIMNFSESGLTISHVFGAPGPANSEEEKDNKYLLHFRMKPHHFRYYNYKSSSPYYSMKIKIKDLAATLKGGGRKFMFAFEINGPTFVIWCQKSEVRSKTTYSSVGSVEIGENKLDKTRNFYQTSNGSFLSVLSKNERGLTIKSLNYQKRTNNQGFCILSQESEKGVLVRGTGIDGAVRNLKQKEDDRVSFFVDPNACAVLKSCCKTGAEKESPCIIQGVNKEEGEFLYIIFQQSFGGKLFFVQSNRKQDS